MISLFSIVDVFRLRVDFIVENGYLFDRTGFVRHYSYFWAPDSFFPFLPTPSSPFLPCPKRCCGIFKPSLFVNPLGLYGP